MDSIFRMLNCFMFRVLGLIVFAGNLLAEDLYEQIMAEIPELKEEPAYIFPIALYHQPDWRALNRNQIQELKKRGVWIAAPLVVGEKEISEIEQVFGSDELLLMDYGSVASGRFVGDEASINYMAAWKAISEDVRESLSLYHSHGFDVAAVWTDWEFEPYRKRIDKSDSVFLQKRSRTKFWTNLLSTYLAAPVLEHYPEASVTNWSVLLGSREKAIQLWNEHQYGLFHPTFFNTTNPVAYGNSEFFERRWPDGDWPKDGAAADKAYFHLLLRQVSQDSWNRLREFPDMKSVPWVVRVVRDSRIESIPTMSREYYREALRHLWFRGIDGMMVFNPKRRREPNKSWIEIEDALAVYSEIVEHEKAIAEGRVLNLRVPSIESKEITWSAVVYEGRILGRAFHFSRIPEGLEDEN